MSLQMLRASCLTLNIDVISFLMERIFQSTPNGVLTAYAEWLPDVRLGHSVPLVQYIQRIVRVGGCPVVIAQWRSTGGSSQRCPGFDSR